MFAREMKVGFQHCDPAGIVFYPRYYEMLNGLIEAWFEEAVGWDFRQIHLVEGLAVPSVRIETDFTAPSRLGDVLVWELRVARLGRTSLELEMTARCGAELRMRNRSVLVQIRQNTGETVPWPAPIRTRIEAAAGEGEE